MSTMALFLDIVIAFIIDLIAGDPYWLPHPVRFIGMLVKKLESLLRRLVARGRGTEEVVAAKERLAGGVLTVAVAGITFLAVLLILKIAAAVHPLVFHAVNIYILYTSLAARCLGSEARKVYKALEAGDLARARKQLSMLVGRDTEQLGREEIVRGAVETTAENTVDGVISPLIYAAAGSFFGLGASVAYAFKAISTMDSMVGYMNDRYINFGRIPAKTDDVANYLPARLSGVLIPLGALLCGLNPSRSFSVMLRDRRNHKSPNCAYPEAAFAGALGIRLGGTNSYFGKPVYKPTIGDADRKIEAGDIPKAVRLMYVASVLALALCAGLAFVILYALKK